MRFDGTVVADTPHYPSDGRGGKTTTAADSFARDANFTVITALVGGTEATGVTFSIFDEDDNEVWYINQDVSNHAIWGPIIFGQDGPVLQGNWYVETSGTTPEWSIQFQIKEGR